MTEMQAPATNSVPPPRSSLLDFVLVLARRKRLVLGIPAVAVLVSAAVALMLPNWYAANTKILPPQQSQSNAVAILGQLGALAGGGGASQALGLRNPSDIYVAMLRSRTVADNLVERFHLLKVYDKESIYYARRELARNSTIVAGREGVLTVEVEDKDPQRAAQIANGYIEELRSLTLRFAVTEAGQRRFFFEGQLKKAKTDLANAEIELKRFTQEAGVVSPLGQVGLTVSAAASLRAQISAREIQMTAMRSFATESNPDLLRVQSELAGLRTELAKMEKDSRLAKGDVLIPVGKAPEVSLEYIRRFRDLKYHETLFEVLAKQYEVARIDEAKDATLIQVLDVATPPERKSKPVRSLIVILSALVGLMIGIVAVLVMESYPQGPTHTAKMQELKTLLGFRRKGS